MVALVACVMYALTYRLRKKNDILCNETTLNINVRKIIMVILLIRISKKFMKTKVCTYEILVFILFILHAFCVYNIHIHV